jgi:hypothetical protein
MLIIFQILKPLFISHNKQMEFLSTVNTLINKIFFFFVPGRENFISMIKKLMI